MGELIDPRSADYCAECPLNCGFADKGGITFVPFEKIGDGTPEVLFVAESPGQDEKRLGRPLIGRSGQLLRRTLSWISNNYILANITTCHPRMGDNRTPLREEILYCAKHVKELIAQYNISKVVILGRSAATGLMDDKDIGSNSIAKLMTRGAKTIDGISYLIIYHPAYLLRAGGEANPDFDVWARRIDSLIKSKVTEHVSLPVPTHVKKLDDMPKVLRYYSNETEIGYDIETRGLDAWYVDFKILGFSISSRSSSTYIEMDREMTSQETDLLRQFLKTRAVWTYNCKFEMKAAWRFLGEYIRFNDTFALCKISNNMRNLKQNAISLLNVSYWADNKDRIVELFGICLDQLKAAKDQEIAAQIRNGDLAKAEGKLRSSISELRRYLTDEEIVKGLSCISPWESCPPEIMGKYCCGDSYYTLLLKDRLWDEAKDQYTIFLYQSWLAGLMESYGLCFDNQMADYLEQYYTEEAAKAIMHLIDNLTLYKTVKTKSEERDENGKKKIIYEAVECTDEQRLNAFNIFNDTSISMEDKLEGLIKIFNPMATAKKNQAPFWDAYKTDFVIGLNVLYALQAGITADRLIPDDFTQYLDKSSVNTSIENLMLAASNTVKIKSRIENLILHAVEGADELGGFNFEMFEAQYRAHKAFGGLDIDDEATWSHEFRLLYDIKRFKKVMKSRQTYIRGSCGRGAVWLSRTDNWRKPPIRLKRFDELPAGYQLKQDELFVFNTEFKENMAETHRWKAAIHTIPAHSELQNLFVSRRRDTINLHMDYSQHEVRTMATMADEESLMKAFESNIDIHKFVASKVWHCDVDAVTSSQRRASKAQTFGVLYGDTPEGVAEKAMNNDIEGARKLFRDFFDAFPKIKQFIDTKHREATATRKVTTLFGNRLDVTPHSGEDPSKLLRNAQNWVIQSTASHLAGYAAYILYEHCQAQGINAIPVGFTHDALDFEVAVKDIDRFNRLLQTIAVDFIRNKYKVPVAIETAYGTSQHQMMDLHEADGVYKFKCSGESLAPIISRLRQTYEVNWTIEGQEETHESLEELFLMRRAFSQSMGQTQRLHKGTLSLTKPLPGTHLAAD